MTNINSKLIKLRFGPVSIFGIVLVAALLAGFWMALESENDPRLKNEIIAKSLKPEANKSSKDVRKARLSLSQIRSDLALKESKFALAFMTLPQPEKRIEYLHQQSLSLTPKDFHMLLDAASADLSRSVRLEALSLLNSTMDSQFRIEYLIAAAQDTDPVVSDIAFHAISEMEVAERIKVLSKILEAEDPMIVVKSADKLASFRTKSSTEAIYLKMISNVDVNIAQQLLQSFGKSIGKKFESLKSASIWWQENKKIHNEDLSLADGV